MLTVTTNTNALFATSSSGTGNGTGASGHARRDGSVGGSRSASVVGRRSGEIIEEEDEDEIEEVDVFSPVVPGERTALGETVIEETIFEGNGGNEEGNGGVGVVGYSSTAGGRGGWGQ